MRQTPILDKTTKDKVNELYYSPRARKITIHNILSKTQLTFVLINHIRLNTIIYNRTNGRPHLMNVKSPKGPEFCMCHIFVM